MRVKTTKGAEILCYGYGARASSRRISFIFNAKRYYRQENMDIIIGIWGLR